GLSLMATLSSMISYLVGSQRGFLVPIIDWTMLPPSASASRTCPIMNGLRPQCFLALQSLFKAQRVSFPPSYGRKERKSVVISGGRSLQGFRFPSICSLRLARSSANGKWVFFGLLFPLATAVA